MKLFTLVLLLMSSVLFARVNKRTYVQDFHYFWWDICTTLKSTNNEYREALEDIESVYKMDICTYVYNYSKVHYTAKAVECYNNKVRMFDCLQEENVMLKALNLE